MPEALWAPRGPPMQRSELSVSVLPSLPLLPGCQLPVYPWTTSPRNASKYFWEQRYWIHALKYNSRYVCKREREEKRLQAIIVDYHLGPADICRPHAPGSGKLPIHLSSSGLLSWLCRRAEISSTRNSRHQHHVGNNDSMFLLIPSRWE